MSSENMHVGDIGTHIRVTISGYDGDFTPTTIKFSFLKPNKTKVSKDGVLYSASNGIVEYVTQDGDLDIKGIWKLQVWVELSDGSWYTNKTTFEVDNNIIDY